MLVYLSIKEIITIVFKNKHGKTDIMGTNKR